MFADTFGNRLSAMSDEPGLFSMLKSPMSGHYERSDSEEMKSLDPSRARNHSNVFCVYSSPDDFKHAGIFRGGLDIGVDPTQLSVNLNSEENLLERMKSPFSQIPMSTSGQLPVNASLFDHMGVSGRHEEEGLALNAPTLQNECFVQDFRLPACYNLSKPKELLDTDIKAFPDSVLFYVFYNMPNDRA